MLLQNYKMKIIKILNKLAISNSYKTNKASSCLGELREKEYIFTGISMF